MSNRDYYFDNAKFLLILLVVFGHLIRSYIHDSHLIFSLYALIYTFHMPAFILISGYFAKGFKKPGYLLKITKKLVLPYFLFQTIYSIFYFILYDERELSINPFDPQWSLWFLLSLFFWNIFLYLFTKINKFLAIFIALTIGIVVGYFEEVNTYLSLSRTFVFFPVFLSGYYLKKEHFSIIRKPLLKKSSFIIFAMIYLGFYLFPEIDQKWLLGSESYVALGYEGIKSGLIRLFFYTISFIATLSFLAIVPTKHYFFTKWGESTLYVYLLHGFFIKTFRNSDVQQYFQEPSHLILLIVIAFLVTILLSSQTIILLTQPFVEVKFTKIKELFINNKWKERKSYDM